MSGLSQLVGHTSGVAHLAEVSATGKLQVVDSAIATALAGSLSVADSAVLTKLGTTLGVADGAVLTKLGTTLAVADGAVATALGGILAVADSAVATALGGTLSVSAPAITASSLLAKDAVSVTNSSTESTTALDLNGARRVCVFGNLNDTSGSIKVEVSRDNVNYFGSSEAVIYVDDTGDFFKTIEMDARYVIFTYTNSSGTSKVLTLNHSFKA